MYNPCETCFICYGKQYSEQCDSSCDYAALAVEKKRLEEEIGELTAQYNEVSGAADFWQTKYYDIMSNRFEVSCYELQKIVFFCNGKWI